MPLGPLHPSNEAPFCWDPLPLQRDQNTPSLKGLPEIICPQAKPSVELWFLPAVASFPRDRRVRHTPFLTKPEGTGPLLPPRSQLLSAHQRGSFLFPKDAYCHRLGPGDRGSEWDQSSHNPHALRLWGPACHGAVSKTPICPALASRLLAREVFAAAPPSESCFCILLPFDTGLLPSLGPRPSPYAAFSTPHPSCLPQCQQLLLTPISGSFLP